MHLSFLLSALLPAIALAGPASWLSPPHQVVVDSTVTDRHLSSIGNEFTSLSHPAFPDHSVRIKKTQGFCDPTVNAYSGYIDVDYGAKHLFFYFFESRSDPDNDDVLMWINGGPGCSSATGLFMELGPCRIDDDPKEGSNGTLWNPYSWNFNANVFFLDQPVGVGFSYADFGETINTSEDAAKNVQAFVIIFFETFKQFRGRAFHMSGESYGGRYLPVFASAVYDGNRFAKSQGFEPINLQSVLIGNGVTDGPTLATSFYDIQCTNASVKPFQTIANCTEMKQAIPRCEKWMLADCIDRQDVQGCAAAFDYCRATFHAPIIALGKNPYDVSKDCEGTIADSLCYPITKKIAQYLNQPSTRSLVGASEYRGNFTSCSPEVMAGFLSHYDRLHLIRNYVTGLLERGVDMLFYAGTYDAQCNWVANYRYTSILEWTGQEDFNAEKMHDWTVEGHKAGQARSARGLTFATVLGAGHMVPYDKPVEALTMLNTWIKERKL